MTSLPAYERLGAFYLGRTVDPSTGETTGDSLLYDAKDLTTHALCVGMTGSGKTGLCVGLLEEAAMDGVPALVIDPKGDLGNLLLSFPRLRPEDFEPWVDPGEATRKGQTVPQYAQTTATRWREGLGSWDQKPARIARMHAAADFAIYTPGSTSGRPLSLLRSLTAPTGADAETTRERVASTVSGLLSLVGIDADPMRSREHVLLSHILERAWSEGRDLALADLIRAVQKPAFTSVGVLDLESFYPAGDRMGLALTLNGLLASPSFASWREGEALDVQKLLWSEEGKPRIAVLSIAHLSDAERMFFVTMLLNEVVAWMRTQPGTSSLRALLYMDEVFGFLPPVQNPPSKRPMLTLLKQARAFGLGVVLATQNPVDVDYKALSNCGTWFLGRLQTERDKQRVLDGLDSAMAASGGASIDRATADALLSGLSSRRFLMNNVHDDRPELFETRWVMSYLRGPLTRDQIATLCARQPAPAAAATVPRPTKKATGQRPVLPAEVHETFLADATGNTPRVYQPALLSSAQLHYTNRSGLDEWEEIAILSPLGKSAAKPWEGAVALPPCTLDLLAEPEDDAQYGALPPKLLQAKKLKSLAKTLKTHLYKTRGRTMFKSKKFKLSSGWDEDRGQFSARVRQAAREKRDLQLEKLRKRYAPKVAKLETRLMKAQQKIDKERQDVSDKKLQTAVSVGSTVLGALFGGRSLGRATTAVRSATRIQKEKQDVARAEESLADLQRKLQDLEAEFEEALSTLEDRELELDIQEVAVRPRKGDLSVEPVSLCWIPAGTELV